MKQIHSIFDIVTIVLRRTFLPRVAVLGYDRIRIRMARLLVLSIMVGPLVCAHGETSIDSPAPSEWSGSTEALAYLGEVTVLGPAMRLPGVERHGEFHYGRVNGGTATGPVLNGVILPAGEDWGSIVREGKNIHIVLDVRYILKTHDGAFVKITYKGRWTGTEGVFEAIVNGKAVEPTQYYSRAAGFFETSDPRYAWLNDIVAVGYGRVERGAGATMRFYQVK